MKTLASFCLRGEVTQAYDLIAYFREGLVIGFVNQLSRWLTVFPRRYIVLPKPIAVVFCSPA